MRSDTWHQKTSFFGTADLSLGRRRSQGVASSADLESDRDADNDRGRSRGIESPKTNRDEREGAQVTR